MDPETAFDEYGLAQSEGRLADAAEYARDLADWARKGGFLPPRWEAMNPGRNRDDFITHMSAVSAYIRQPEA